ncbi:LysR substrate-binding domain-containing protein [Sphingomonas sp. HITSZ_GF]|uniref:LysR substrate-binding domain-containing protein n=1 Tax=Sphingomonas sp. HITSZ_GF TaxID=3037247 RepID=UPI00240E4B56|nr:LysR substrate-binding domain-containing protein [Sphingomonas sp. HITSZ_GF]MDG2533128.1 LysR substrate-binding domain-containing protein [Sphingomonas sp. HITSZ_GF]
MRRLPPLAAVRVFEAAARHGNFTRAAEELGMTQAAVSYQMKLLEERLGAPLFARSGRGIALTDLGRRIAPQITTAFDAMGDAFAAVHAESESVMRITAPRTLATNWLAGRLGSFQLARPELAVRLHVGDDMVDLLAGEADVALRGAPGPIAGHSCHFLMRMPVAPFASPALLARHPQVRTPADLLELPRVSPHDDWWDLWFAAAMGEAPANNQAGVRFDSQILDGNAAIAGHGVAILSAPMWLGAVQSGQLVQVLPQRAYYRNAFWLMYAEGKRSQPKIRAFRDWLMAEVKASMGDDPHQALVPPKGG